MEKNDETVCHALGVPDFTEGEDLALKGVLFKLVTKEGYYTADALIDLIMTLKLPDTPENRRLAARAFSFGQAVQDTKQRISEVFGSDE